LERKPGTLTGRRLEDLSGTVNDLFQKAVQNEQILRRYQQFELKLLDLEGFENLLDMLLHNSLDYFHLDSIELWLYDPQGTLKELLADEYLSLPTLKLVSRPDELQSLYAKQPEVRLVSMTEKHGMSIFQHQPVRSAALLPLVRHGVIVGSLHFGANGRQRFTVDKSTDFIAHLASIISVCLENAVNQERLHHLSMYDTLTRVKNRRAFHQALDKEISRAARSGDPLSLLFVDIDYFKQVNDTYGHPMGDKVLRAVAQYINEMLRKTDHVCRYGGEEFALILPNCGQQRAMEIAERIRLQIAELVITDRLDDFSQESEAVTEVSVTLSIGVCCWLPMAELDQSGEAEIARKLVACSDQGVYQSKAAGRNSVHYVPINS
jgi:diguanylate cyclase (GGDEF)-like protein